MIEVVLLSEILFYDFYTTQASYVETASAYACYYNVAIIFS